MKNRLIAPFLFLLLGTSVNASAASITFDSVSATGTYYHSLDLLTDGTFPDQGANWDGGESVYFNQWEPSYDVEYFTFDMGSLYTIDDIEISVDNNDSYTIEHSTDNSTWSNLTTVQHYLGSAQPGMDTFSSISGDAQYEAGIDFDQSGAAQYIRIHVQRYCAEGDSGFCYPNGDNAFAIGEFQAFGDTAVVPIPAAAWLFGSALVGLVTVARSKQLKA